MLTTCVVDPPIPIVMSLDTILQDVGANVSKFEQWNVDEVVILLRSVRVHVKGYLSQAYIVAGKGISIEPIVYKSNFGAPSWLEVDYVVVLHSLDHSKSGLQPSLLPCWPSADGKTE